MNEKLNYDVVARQKYFNNHFIVTAHVGIADRHVVLAPPTHKKEGGKDRFSLIVFNFFVFFYAYFLEMD